MIYLDLFLVIIAPIVAIGAYVWWPRVGKLICTYTRR